MAYQYKTETSTNTDAAYKADTLTATRPSSTTDNSSDTRTQTTAPVSAQSPTLNIYNINMSPNAMSTDSAPVNVTDASQPLASLGVPDVNGAGTRILALAPSANYTPYESFVPQPPPSAVNITTPAPVAIPSPSAPPPKPALPQPQRIEPVSLSLPADVGAAVICNMPDPRNGKIYRVQVGAFKETWNAREAFDHLTMVGFTPAYERYGDYIRVVIPGIRSADIPAVARLIGKVGLKEALVREENY
jgi:hypothetical protein